MCVRGVRAQACVVRAVYGSRRAYCSPGVRGVRCVRCAVGGRTAQVGEEVVLATCHPVEIHDDHLLPVRVRHQLRKRHRRVGLSGAAALIKIVASGPAEADEAGEAVRRADGLECMMAKALAEALRISPRAARRPLVDQPTDVRRQPREKAGALLECHREQRLAAGVLEFARDLDATSRGVGAWRQCECVGTPQLLQLYTRTSRRVAFKARLKLRCSEDCVIGGGVSRKELRGSESFAFFFAFTLCGCIGQRKKRGFARRLHNIPSAHAHAHPSCSILLHRRMSAGKVGRSWMARKGWVARSALDAHIAIELGARIRAVSLARCQGGWQQKCDRHAASPTHSRYLFFRRPSHRRTPSTTCTTRNTRTRALTHQRTQGPAQNVNLARASRATCAPSQSRYGAEKRSQAQYSIGPVGRGEPA